MTNLSDTQAVILTAASQREDRLALPLPATLKGGAAHKVVSAMLTRGFLAEADAGRDAPVWRETGDGHGVTLVATDAGLAAIGIEPDDADAANAGTTPTVADPEPRVRTPREGTKQATLVAMLRRPEGATIAEIIEATQWQSHTVRGAMSGALKKRLGLVIDSRTEESRGRVYFIIG